MEKIFISGPAGIGKTTLAKYIALRKRIPFIQGSSKNLWEKYDIQTHLDILNLPLGNALQFQYELLDLRMENVKGVSNMVSDRSPIDNAVYFLLQNAKNINDEETSNYLYRCRKDLSILIEEGAKFIYLSANPKAIDRFPLENDGMRINSQWYQDYVVGSMFDRIIKENILEVDFNTSNFINIPLYDWEARIKTVEAFLQPSPFEKFANRFDKYFRS